MGRAMRTNCSHANRRFFSYLSALQAAEALGVSVSTSNAGWMKGPAGPQDRRRAPQTAAC